MKKYWKKRTCSEHKRLFTNILFVALYIMRLSLCLSVRCIIYSIDFSFSDALVPPSPPKGGGCPCPQGTQYAPPLNPLPVIRICQALIPTQNLKAGQSVPIPRHSQTRAQNAGLVTLETQNHYPQKYYDTPKRINK